MTALHFLAGLSPTPTPVQRSPLLAIPVLLVLQAMIYWLNDVLRARRRLHP